MKVGTSSYAYDDNGNMTTDGNQGATLTYNNLNLPKTVPLAGLLVGLEKMVKKPIIQYLYNLKADLLHSVGLPPLLLFNSTQKHFPEIYFNKITSLMANELISPTK